MESPANYRPTAIFAGALVVGGSFFLFRKNKKKCSELSGIYKEKGPIFLTETAQSRVRDLAKNEIYEFATAQAPFSEEEVSLRVARDLRNCNWSGDLNTIQRRVLISIQEIVSSEKKIYEKDPAAWVESYDS